MKAMYEEEKDNKVKLEDGMLKLRQYYDDKLHSVDGQIANLPPTAAGQFVIFVIFAIKMSVLSLLPLLYEPRYQAY